MTTQAHDITLDGTGFVLLRDKAKARQWSYSGQADSRAQRGEEDARFGQLPAVLRVPKVFTSGHEGYGHAEDRGAATYHYTVNGDASVPDQFLRAPALTSLNVFAGGRIVDFFEQDGAVFALAGRYVLKVNTDDTHSIDQDLGSGIAAQPAPIVWQGAAYVGIGAGGGFWKRASGGTWTQAASSLLSYGFVAAQDTLFRASNTYQMSACDALADPLTAANWSAASNIGDSTAAITGLASVGYKIYVGKTDGLYNHDTEGHAPNLLTQIGALPNSKNCQQMRSYGPLLLVPLVRGMLGWNDTSGDLLPIQPGYETSNAGPIRGQITALAVDGAWVYAALTDPDGTCWLLKGRPREERDRVPGHFVWHTIRTLGTYTCDALWLTGFAGGNPRLYLALNNAYWGEVAYLTLPAGADQNPIYDGGCTVTEEAAIILSATDLGSAGTTKIVESVDVVGDNLSTTDYAEVLVGADAGIDVFVGRAEADGLTTLTPPTPIAGERFTVTVLLKGTSETRADRAGVVRKVVLNAIERPPIVGIWSGTVRLTTGIRRRDAAAGTQSIEALVGRLDSLAESATQILLVDPYGRRLFGHLLPTVQYREMKDESQRPDLDPELVAQIQFAVREIRPPAARYGSALYDRNDEYSTGTEEPVVPARFGAARYGNGTYD